MAWVRAGGGLAELMVAPADGTGPAVVVTADTPVASVGAYGGGAFTWATPDQIAYAGADGRLLAVSAGGGPPRALTGPGDGRAAAPAAAGDGRGRLACILETDDGCEIAEVGLDGRASPQRRSGNADYAWDPAWSPDGRYLAWHEWDFPNMPWDGSRIVLHDRESGSTRVVAGGDAVSVSQPRFSPDGSSLAYVSDASGFANVWVAQPDGSRARPVLDEPFEHAEPTWGPGQRSFAWSPDGSALAVCRNERGFGRLVVARVDGGVPREVAKGWQQGLDWGPAGIVAVRSGARTPLQIVVTDPSAGTRRVVDRGPVGGFEAADLVEPEAVAWRGEGGAVHGLLWRPHQSACGAGTKPPLLVHVHGGPNGQAVAGWSARVHYFLERGWAVLQPNFRGSTGYGRDYTQALARRWGELDVVDVAAGIRHAARQGWCDPARVAAMGGSAGGMTVYLLCAMGGGLLRAGVSLYGVTDLFDLAATTHRFESRYVDRLVGGLPGDADRYRAQSPITHAASIAVPMLVLQGDADKAVPKAQADAMVDAMRRAGAEVEYHVYEGEGHGWSRPETIVDELLRTEGFLERWVLAR